MFQYIVYSIKRRKTANLIIIAVSIMLVILLNLYFGSINSYQKQLEELAENVPVYCQITSRNGSLRNGLFIPEKTVDALQRSERIKDLSCMAILMAGEGDFDKTEYTKHLNLYVAGINRAEAAGELTTDMIHMDEEEAKALLDSGEMACIVSEKVMKKRQWEIGDKILLNFYYYSADSEYRKLAIHPMGGVVEVEIAGTMEDFQGKTTADCTDIIMPLEAVRNVFHQFEHPFFADTVTFHVRDPLQLNAFKEEMRSIGLVEAEPEAADSYTGCALAVRDGSFITSATDLQHTIELMKSFIPAVCVLVILTGYVVSYLSGGSRKEEYALLRLQGMKKSKVTILFLLEQMMLVLAGNLAGDVIIAVLSPDLSAAVFVNGVLLAAYLVGAAAAYGRMSRGSVVRLLSVEQ